MLFWDKLSLSVLVYHITFHRNEVFDWNLHFHKVPLNILLTRELGPKRSSCGGEENRNNNLLNHQQEIDYFMVTEYIVSCRSTWVDAVYL